MAAHRYWRIWSSVSGYSGATALAEVQLLDRSGGTNRVGLGTASASNVYGSQVAANAVDGNISTYWSTANDQAWWQYDFGAGNAYDIGSVNITPRQDLPATAPYTFSIQFSDDGNRWSTAFTVIGVTWTTAAQTFTIPAPVAGTAGTGARFWRLNITNSAYGSSVAIADVEFQRRGDNVNVAGSGVASAYSEYSSTYAASMAVDVDLSYSTYWQNANGVPPPGWWQYDFGSGVSVDVAVVVITCRSNNTQTTAPQDFSIQASNDGSTWTTVATFSGTTWTYLGQQQKFVTPAVSLGGGAVNRPIMFVVT